MDEIIEEVVDAVTDMLGIEDHDDDRCINYVELNVTDIERAKSFYGEAFGWTFTDYGPEYCEFNDGKMKGGFALMKPEDVVLGGPLVVLYADDLEEVMADIKKAGGQISVPIFEFPGGKRFQFTDPEGYELAVWTHL
ncbi:VOC family protein [Curvivirga sp.]|uniref:VOC family protein n=1 Tax=Curvivirga sp. TaxID=2856848 RepID=UPI003B5CEFE3